MTEEKLIILVQAHKCLYDITSRYYSDHQMKQNAWTEISREMNKTPGDCLKLWTKIRNNYRKSLKSRTCKSGDAAINQRPIKYEKELLFLNSFLENRSQISNLDSPTDDTQDGFTTSPPSCPASQASSHSESQLPQRKSQKSHPQSHSITTAEILQQYIYSKKDEEHPVDIFFKSMAVTVKTLPLRIQAEVKQNVLRIVNEAEIASLSNTNQGTTGIMLSEQQPTARGCVYEPSTNNPLLSQTHYSSTPTSRSTLPYIPTPISRNQEDSIENDEYDYENI